MKKISKIKSLKTQLGLSLVEIMVGLGIVAAMIVGGLALGSGAGTAQKTQQLTSDLMAILGSTQQLAYQSGTYGIGSLNDVLINSGRLPKTLRVTGSTINHQFQGDIVVTGATTFYHIRLNTIPQDACIGLLTQTAGFIGARTGTTAPADTTAIAAPASPSVGTTYSLPLTAQTANALCAATPNTIFFVGR